nr:hypothetical protein Q903MT_gene4896 [Picea sitchensis]
MNRIRVMAKPNPRAMKPKIPIIHSLSCGIHPWNSIPITESCKMSFRAYYKVFIYREKTQLMHERIDDSRRDCTMD